MRPEAEFFLSSSCSSDRGRSHVILVGGCALFGSRMHRTLPSLAHSPAAHSLAQTTSRSLNRIRAPASGPHTDASDTTKAEFPVRSLFRIIPECCHLSDQTTLAIQGRISIAAMQWQRRDWTDVLE